MKKPAKAKVVRQKVKAKPTKRAPCVAVNKNNENLSLFGDPDRHDTRKALTSSLSLFGSSTASRLAVSINSNSSESILVRRIAKRRRKSLSTSTCSSDSVELIKNEVKTRRQKKVIKLSPSYHDKIPDFSSIEKFSLLVESADAQKCNPDYQSPVIKDANDLASSTPMYNLRNRKASFCGRLSVSYIPEDDLSHTQSPVVVVSQREKSQADCQLPVRVMLKRTTKTNALRKIVDRDYEQPLTDQVNKLNVSDFLTDDESSRDATNDKENIDKDKDKDCSEKPKLKVGFCALNPDNSLVVSTAKSESFSTPAKQMDAKLKRMSRRRLEVDFNVRASIKNNDSVLSCGDVSEAEMDLEESYWVMFQSGQCKESVLKLCDQTDYLSWETVLTPDMLENLTKVGEGVYGEVFCFKRGSKDVALKLFPIQGRHKVNGEPQKLFHEILSEILISKKLTDLSYKYRENKSTNFVQLLRCAIVQGPFHPRLDEEWQAFIETRTSDNENPNFLPRNQLWMLLEYKFAGAPLDQFKFSSYREARSVILQLALSLASAEVQFEFEHRDLHWGNVLVHPTQREKLRYKVQGSNYAVLSEGLEVTIIDFTVSRMSPTPGHVVYIDMSVDPDIFVGEGDYQFEIYRMMRAECGDEWRSFNPRTNLMWLHYLLDKFLKETSFPRRDPDCDAIQSELSALSDCLLKYNSCQSLVQTNFYFAESSTAISSL